MSQSLDPCPHCWIKFSDQLASPGRESGRRYLHPTQAINCLSRRDNETYICGDCGKTEALADMLFPERGPDFDEMMRTVVYSDRCEGRRLPPGIPWGPSLTLTSGSVVGHPDEFDDRCEKCGSYFAWGFSCTECHTLRENAYLKLKDHPVLVEKHRADEEQAERERQWKIEEEARKAVAKEVDEFIGYATDKKECVNCGEENLQHREDYICLKCRALEQFQGQPLLQHILYKLDKRLGRT